MAPIEQGQFGVLQRCCTTQQAVVELTGRIKLATIQLVQGHQHLIKQRYQRPVTVIIQRGQRTSVVVNPNRHSCLGMEPKPGGVETLDQLVEARGLIHSAAGPASVMVKSCASLALFSSIIETEQYFSAESFTARSTAAGFRLWPVIW